MSILTDMVEEDVEVAIPPPSWVIAFFAFMLVLGLAMGSTEWGKSHLQLFLGDWLFKALLFASITAIYGYQVWGVKIERTEENDGD
jgi:hypothetical protein